MKKYLAVPGTVRCSMQNGETIYLSLKQGRVWCWRFGHGGSLSPVEMFPIWRCLLLAGIPMAVPDGDMYRAAFVAPTWFMESLNSDCQFPEMDCLASLPF